MARSGRSGGPSGGVRCYWVQINEPVERAAEPF